MSKSQVVKKSVIKGKRTETLSFTTTPAVRAEVEEIARDKERSKSWVIEALVERALEAYKKDGLLKPAHHIKLRRA